MKSILIIGTGQDTFSRYLKRAAALKNINPVIIKPDDLFDGLIIELNLNCNNSESELRSGKEKIDLSNLIAVFPGVTNLIRSSNPESGKDSIYKANESNSFYKGWLRSFSIPVINLLSPQYWNKRALGPADLFQYSGKIDLIIPGFIISNVFGELKEFFSACGGKVMYCPQTLTSAHYQVDTEKKFMKLSSLLKFMQVTLYEAPEGIHYKIFAANNHTFTVNAKGSQSKAVPENILNDCIFLSKKFNLSLAEFTVIVKGNEFYLTNINLIPDFSGCSEPMAMKIINGVFKGIGIN